MVTLTVHTRRRILIAAVALLAGSFVWTCYLLVAGRPIIAAADARQPQPHPPVGTADRAEQACMLWQLDEYAVIYRKPLRSPLFDPPPQAPPAKARPKMPVTLEGTAVEPGHSYAFLATADGVRIVGAGEVLEGVEVLEINDQSVTVRFDGEITILTLAKDSGGRHE